MTSHKLLDHLQNNGVDHHRLQEVTHNVHCCMFQVSCFHSCTTRMSSRKHQQGKELLLGVVSDRISNLKTRMWFVVDERNDVIDILVENYECAPSIRTGLSSNFSLSPSVVQCSNHFTAFNHNPNRYVCMYVCIHTFLSQNRPWKWSATILKQL